MDVLPTVFNYESNQIRTIIKDNEVWFVAKDICDVLDLNDVSKAVSRLDTDEKGTNSIRTLGGDQDMLCINESGLYSMILTSRKPEAKLFKRWITHDVIPSIRKTGSYSVPSQPISTFTLPTTYLEALKALVVSEEEKAIMKPKADYFDALVDSNLLTNFRDTAKELKIKEKVFINWLLDNRYLYRNSSKSLRPYAKHTPALFELKEKVNAQNEWTGGQTFITPKGRETFRLLLSNTQLLIT